MRRVSRLSLRSASDAAMTSPLALIHGWGQHGGVWSELMTQLAAPSVLNLELPGHGAAPAAGFALDALVDAYAAQAPSSCTVLGWSLGGMLALRWAHRYPQQVERLVLFATTPCFGERADWAHGSPAAVQLAFAALVKAAPEAALQRFADLLAVGESDLRGVRRRLRALLAEQPTPPIDMLLAGLHFLADTDLRAGLLADPPAQPVLIIHGEGDTITPLGAAWWLAKHLPQARLHAVALCGHAPMVSHVAEAAALVKAFLDE